VTLAPGKCTVCLQTTLPHPSPSTFASPCCRCPRRRPIRETHVAADVGAAAFRTHTKEQTGSTPGGETKTGRPIGLPVVSLVGCMSLVLLDAPRRNRTYNLVIKSHLLCQLS
jgi:hypothetical protein